jgi:hypothetical protein
LTADIVERVADIISLFFVLYPSTGPRFSLCCRSNSSPPEAQRSCESCYQGLPPKQTGSRGIYRTQVENGSDKNTVILPEVAVAFGDLDQIRMCHFSI